MKNYVQPGKAIDVVAPSGGMVAGRAYVFNGMIGVAPVDADAGDVVSLWVDGVFRFPKEDNTAMAVGSVAYWSPDTNDVSASSSQNTRLGLVAKAAAGGDATVDVKLIANVA